MARIAVLGGTGYTGGAIVREAAARGHHVTVYSRNAAESPVEGVHHLRASLLEEGAVAAAVAGQDVVVEAMAPRGELEGRLDGIVADLARLAPEQGARLIVIGGWSGLRPAEGEPRFVEGDVPPQFRPEAEEMVRALEALEQAPAGLDWLFVSPAQGYGAYAPGEATGTYRVGGEVALPGADGGPSTLSAADLALAVVDEIERHERTGHINVAG